VLKPAVRQWCKIADPGTCNKPALYNAAMAANPSVGAPTKNNHVVIYFPTRADCGDGWAGQGSINGGIIWDNGLPWVDLTAHEFGHNLGIGHANASICWASTTRVTLSKDCQEFEYADSADVMGVSTSMESGNLTSGLADFLGLARVTTVKSTITRPVVVDLAPLAAVTSMRAVKINVPATRAGETRDIYIDYRPNTGRDVREPTWAGVQVHVRSVYAGYPKTEFLDLKPNLGGAFASPSLQAGASWTIPGTPLTVKVMTVGATARVIVGPTVSLERYVTAVYNDLFHRGPDAVGLTTWTSKLASGTPRIAVANAITGSDEYRRNLIRGSYQEFLNRGADTVGLANWLVQMKRGVTIQQMEGGFIASAEYYGRAGGNDAAWVSALYTDVLGRAPAASEVTTWVTRLHAAGGGRYRVAMGFLMSGERLGAVVNGHYVALLGRGLDATGRASWVRQLQRGVRIEAVIGGIVASNEYYAKS